MRAGLVALGIALALACAGPAAESPPAPVAPVAPHSCSAADVQLTLGGQRLQGLQALVDAGRAGQLPGDPPVSGFERVEFDPDAPMPCTLDLGPVQLDNVVDYLGLSATGAQLAVVDGTSAMRSLRVYALPGLAQVYSASVQDAQTVRRHQMGFTSVVVTDKRVRCADPELEASGMTCYELREMKLGEKGQVREGPVRGVAARE
jgi:hypothetical protein